jgi:hypothetical protein
VRLAILRFNLYMCGIDIWPDYWAASPRTVRRTFQTLSKIDDPEQARFRAWSYVHNRQ